MFPVCVVVLGGYIVSARVSASACTARRLEGQRIRHWIAIVKIWASACPPGLLGSNGSIDRIETDNDRVRMAEGYHDRLVDRIVAGRSIVVLCAPAGFHKSRLAHAAAQKIAGNGGAARGLYGQSGRAHA